MVEPNTKINLFDLDRKGLEHYLAGIGAAPFRARQLLQWIHQRRVTDFSMMSDLSKPLRATLAATAEVRVPDLVLQQASSDGTYKWLVGLSCGNHIETVFIPEERRGTLCVSSQVGCALACSFCSTARQGMNRNLSVSEIIGQLWLANGELCGAKITNVVMMGMGEPLLNFDNVVAAMDLMMDDYAYGLSKRHVTLSTSGVVPAIDQLREVSDVRLAVSLHAPNDALRDQLVPINRKYPIAELLAACKRYIQREHRSRVTWEYVMLDGINDRPADARDLARLLQGIPSKVNLIPFNPFPRSPYRCSSVAAIEQFRDIVTRSGIVTTTRKTRGDDIDAACGQLVGKVQDRSRRRWLSQITA